MNIPLKALQLKAKRQVYTLLSGHNLSKLHGEGYDFAELREYQMGDDIRKINWTITAKLGKPYIKELHANRELSIVVCALMDASLYFGTGNAKQTKLCEVATILGYAAEQNADLFTGIAYTQNQVIDTPPTKQLYHINHFSESLYEENLLHTTLDKQQAIDTLFKRIHKPSLVFVLGDFLEEVSNCLMFGASPRASIDLYKAAKAKAFLRGNSFVSPADIGYMIHNVLRHRIVLSYEARAKGIHSDEIISKNSSLQIKDER